MKKYEHGDRATFYFIIAKSETTGDYVQAWSDDKDLIEAYLEFHHCKNFKLKKIDDIIDNITPLIEENIHDEIQVFPILTRDRDSKKSYKTKQIYIPATETERQFINEECQTFLATVIRYSVINEYAPRLRHKYQRALDDILLSSVVYAIVHNKSVPVLNHIDFDHLAILYKCFPHNFGI